jgi:hypothetical protein
MLIVSNLKEERERERESSLFFAILNSFLGVHQLPSVFHHGSNAEISACSFALHFNILPHFRY